MDDITILQQNVRLRLAQLGTNLSKLAGEKGYSRARVSFWVNGNPTLSTLAKLGRVLGVPTWALICPDFDPRAYPKSEEKQASI